MQYEPPPHVKSVVVQFLISIFAEWFAPSFRPYIKKNLPPFLIVLDTGGVLAMGGYVKSRVYELSFSLTFDKR